MMIRSLKLAILLILLIFLLPYILGSHDSNSDVDDESENSDENIIDNNEPTNDLMNQVDEQVITILVPIKTSTSWASIHLPFLLVGFCGKYPTYLFTRTNLLQKRYANTPYSETYLSIISYLISGSIVLVSVIYTFIGEKLRNRHACICTWGLAGQAIVCTALGVLLVVPISDTIFGITVMILAAISGGLMAITFSSSMAVAAKLPNPCAQSQITGQWLADLLSNTLLFTFATLNTTTTRNDTIIIPTEEKLGSMPLDVGFLAVYFFAGVFIIATSSYIWGFGLPSGTDHKRAIVNMLPPSTLIISEFSLIKEIFSSWNYAIYPCGVILTAICSGIVSPFFTTSIASSSDIIDTFHTKLFTLFNVLIYTIISVFASLLPSIRSIRNISTSFIFFISFALLFVFVPVFCLMNIESTDPATGEPVYPSAPRFIKSDPAYYALMIAHSIIYGILPGLFFIKSKSVPLVLRNTMIILCSLVFNLGSELGKMFAVAVSEMFSKEK